jgi:hypothetical protein
VKAAYTLSGESATDTLLAYPMENPVWITAASAEDIVLRMGDSAGVNKVSIRNYTNSEVAYILSNGTSSFTSTYADNDTPYYFVNTTRPLTGSSIVRSVNNDYLMIVGGTGSLNYSSNIQLYGGDNVAQSGGLIVSVGNASGSNTEVVFSSLGRTDTPTLDLNNNKIISLADPTSAQDAATKKYVDDVNATLVTGTFTSTYPLSLNNIRQVIGGNLAMQLVNDVGGTITEVTTNTTLPDNNSSVPTSGAVKHYVDTKYIFGYTDVS